MRAFIDDLVSLGVSPQVANSFAAATAQPIQQVSENGKGGGNSPTTTSYQTVDGGTVSEAQLQAYIKASQAANPQASGGGYEGVGTPDHPGPAGTTNYGNPNVSITDTQQTGNTPVLNWKSYLTDWGFTPEIVNELDRIFRVYSDPSQAGAAALAYVRGTDWYAQTFAGIGAGLKNGLISDEAGYRAYTNQLDQIYQRYQGRNVSTQEVANALLGGKNAGQIDAHFQGGAWVNANRNDIQYELGAFDQQGRATEDQLSALGDQQAGLDNLIGPQLQQRLDSAKQKMARVFQGSIATPSLSVLNNGRLVTSAGAARNPDIAT